MPNRACCSGRNCPKARACAPGVIAYALEEQLINETDAEHFGVGAGN